MEIRYLKHYSSHLYREMEIKIYGHAGKPVLFIPCQSGRFFDFENFKMTDVWAPWIDSGQCKVFSVDTMDEETWSKKEGDPLWRIERHEQWMRYLVDEVAPFVRHMAREANGWMDTVNNLPKYADGVEITYSWTEEELPEGYASSMVKSVRNRLKISRMFVEMDYYKYLH